MWCWKEDQEFYKESMTLGPQGILVKFLQGAFEEVNDVFCL
jgi:hypothetical protein